MNYLAWVRAATSSSIHEEVKETNKRFLIFCFHGVSTAWKYAFARHFWFSC